MECFDPCAALANRKTAVSSFTQQQQTYWPVVEEKQHDNIRCVPRTCPTLRMGTIELGLLFEQGDGGFDSAH